MGKFTDAKVRNLKPQDKKYLVTDGSGLYVQVSPKGLKTWLFIYSFKGKEKPSKQKRRNLGHYPDMSLEKANAERDRLSAKVRTAKANKSLEDPIEAEQEAQRLKEAECINAPTVEKLVEEYLTRYAKPNKKSWKEDERILEKDVVPAWGKRKAADIRRRDVIFLLEGIADRGAPNQALQTLKIIRRMFNFAIEREVLENNPCSHVKPPEKPVSKERFLSIDEIKSFWEGLDGAGMADETKRVLKLILVTAQRPGEVAGMHSKEIEGKWWTIPAERTKNKKTHRVYLSDLALELIGEIPKDAYLFSPGKFYSLTEEHKRNRVGKPGDPIQVNALAHALRAALKPDEKTGKAKVPIAEHFTPHDLRRTAASQMSAIGISRFVVERVLNHSDRSVTGIYDRYSYDKEKQQALESWERKLRKHLLGKEAGKVISLPTG